MFRIYGKLKTEKRFRPYDYNAGRFVVNLLYATLFAEEKRAAVVDAVGFMNENNPLYVFEMRKVKT